VVFIEQQLLFRKYYREVNSNNDWKNIIHVFCSTCDNESDAYCCFTSFLKLIGQKSISSSQQQQLIHKQVDSLFKQIKLHDIELWNYFKMPTAVKLVDITGRWFDTYFANIFPAPYLEKIWDLVIAYSPDIFVFLALFLLLHHKKIIITLNKNEDIYLYINLQDISAEYIYEKVLDLYTSFEKEENK